MNELELLKKAWQNDATSYREVSELEIHAMIHRKSSLLVKWILVISIIELGLGVFLSLCLSFTKVDTQSITLIKNWGLYPYYIGFAIIIYLATFYFISRFYQMYRKISVLENTQTLMKHILDTRKVVKQYIAFNLSTFAFLVVTMGVFALKESYIQAMRMRGVAHPDMPFETKLLGILIIIGLAAVLTFGFWLVYRLVYGILLRKLRRNYEELKKMD
jgi:hypothetical protein